MARYYIDKYTGRLERTDLYLVRLIKKDGSVYNGYYKEYSKKYALAEAKAE